PIDTTTIDSHIKKKRTAKNFPPKLIRKIHFNTTKVTKLHIESTAVQEKSFEITKSTIEIGEII
ncbi:hypothetical protein, partial [Enterobacter quasiroggenkampii]|uniref:hypothetical protein n=1 Tax=Enterobacter quasiroggenkampii TaxID=2497436 RepID=UPI0021D38373